MSMPFTDDSFHLLFATLPAILNTRALAALVAVT